MNNRHNPYNQNISKYGDGDLGSNQILGNAERLALVQHIHTFPIAITRITLGVESIKNLEGENRLTELSIRITRREDTRLEISFEFFHKATALPRVLGCVLEPDGTPFSVLETFFNEQPSEKQSGYEGMGIYFGYDDFKKNPATPSEPGRAEAARALLSRFDCFLQLAATGQRKQFGLN